MNRIKLGDWKHSTSLLLLKRVYRFFKYKEERARLFREVEIKRIQDNHILNQFDPAAENLIIFFVPGADRSTGKETISGGVISLVSICEETKKLKPIHKAETIACIFPRDFLFIKHENFPNQTNIYRFEQLPVYFKNAKNITIHLPELMVSNFKDALLNFEIKWLKKKDLVHINIINANIQLMPAPLEIDSLSEIADLITITAAHTKYCTKNFRDFYKKPLHKFSAWISPEQYIYRPYAEKENLLVVSPDENPSREHVMQKLQSIQGLEIVVLQNFKYQKFKEIIGKAKWAITFGEGLDGYILEPIFSGAIGFAVYNEEFFTEDFKTLKGIFASYENMAEVIVKEIKLLDSPYDYKMVQKQQFQLCAKHYNFGQYQENIKKFYLQDYTFK